MNGVKDRIRRNPWSRWILVVSNWISQGILHADTTERAYKILFSLFFSAVFFVLLLSLRHHPVGRALVEGILAGHTLNWVLNSNLCGVIVHRLFLSRVDKEKAFAYLLSLSDRLSRREEVLYSTAHGSLSKGRFKPSSDIDVALVRKKGSANAMKALFFLVRERKTADFRGIPLEIFLSDTPDDAKRRFREESNPLVLFDPQGVVRTHYRTTLTLPEARRLNGLPA
jgi:hypothetical protein